MSKTWRIGIIGTGVVGEWHVRILPQLANAKLVAVCDLNTDKSNKILERNKQAGLPVYADYHEMLAKEDLDAVTVATPSGNHAPPVLAAIKAGKNVIVEKPMEIHVDRIDAMHEAARRKGVKIAGIFQNRWNDVNRLLKNAADQNRFGRIAWAGSFTPWHRTDEYYQADGAWRGTWALDGGGAIMNQSVHAVDLLQWIVGPVRQVSAYSASRIHPNIETEDTLSASLIFESGAFGSILGSTAMWPGQHVRMEVGGESGTAVSEGGLKVFRFKDQNPDDEQLLAQHAPGIPDAWKKRIADNTSEEQQIKIGLKAPTTTSGASSPTDVPPDLHARNILSIFKSWDKNEEAETNPAEARKAVAIIEALYQSAKQNGAPVQVKK